MGIENDIQRLFQGVLDEHNGNKAAAAASLNVNAVTFWHWVTKTRKMPSTLCKAIDSAGGKLLLPGEAMPTSLDQDAKVESLLKEINSLIRERDALLDGNNALKKLVEINEEEIRDLKRNKGGAGGDQADLAGAGRPDVDRPLKKDIPHSQKIHISGPAQPSGDADDQSRANPG